MKEIQIVVLIPSLNPDQRLVQLVDDLQGQLGCPICVVDDGSGPSFSSIFSELEHHYHCVVLHHQTNKGKGAALKTGLAFIQQQFATLLGVVTADADGQHSAKDIAAIAEGLQQNPSEFVIGSRDFSLPQVPWKSRWGNRITSFIFQAVTKKTCSDTQTGLRAIPMDYIPLALKVPGQRFEYEMNMLLKFVHHHISLIELPIETIYYGNNEHSHFKSWSDSFRIYWNLIKIILAYGLPSIGMTILEWIGFFIIVDGIHLDLMQSIVIATVITKIFKRLGMALINKRWKLHNIVFHLRRITLSLIFFIILIALSSFLVYNLVENETSILLSKTFVELGLFVIVQVIIKLSGKLKKKMV